MCGTNIFPNILKHAGIPLTFKDIMPENNAATLRQIFADRPEKDFLTAAAVFTQFETKVPGGITLDTTIGELRAATRKRIIADNAELASQITGLPANAVQGLIEAASFSPA